MQCSQCGCLTGNLKGIRGKSKWQKFCPGCHQMLKSPITVTGADGRKHYQTTGMCNCCGLGAGPDGSPEGFLIFDAGFGDGEVFYSRLCGHPTAEQGCIFEVDVPEKDSKTELIREIAAGDGDWDAAADEYETLPDLDEIEKIAENI